MQSLKNYLSKKNNFLVNCSPYNIARKSIIMYNLHPRKPKKHTDRISLYSGFWIQIKRKLRTFFKRYFIKTICICRKEMLHCDDFNTSFSTFVNTWFIVSMLLSLFYFLPELFCEVQTWYKSKMRYIYRDVCARNSSRQTLLPDNFFWNEKRRLFSYSIAQILIFLRKHIIELHLNS